MQSEKHAQEGESAGNGRPADATGTLESQLNETEAIKLARRGDSTGFERLYRLHSKRVYSLCLRMLANATEAEDMTQEVFLQVFRKIHTFRADALLSTWLHRVTYNAILMHFRRRAPLETYPQKLDAECGASAWGDQEVRHGFVTAKGILDRLHLERAMAKLPGPWKIVFVLHDVQGFKHEEIARLMHFSNNTSKAYLRRARLRLRQLLLSGSYS
jgi:RNA polymerase sigma-70 factor, ECF subfamily